MQFNFFLSFSDAAKIADIARNFVQTGKMTANFLFFSINAGSNVGNTLAYWVLPIMPATVALFFNLFGISDASVIAASSLYFILTIIFTFFLARKIFKSNLVGALSALAVGFNYDLIHYGLSGASEAPFIFEIIASIYFISLRKQWANITGGIFLVMMYFTRPQAFIYILGVVLFWLLLNFKTRKAILMFFLVSVAGFLIDHFFLAKFSGRYFIYSVTFRAATSAFSQSAADILRGAVKANSVGIILILKNIFYNIYNFYKLLPQIINPYLFALFFVGIFKWGKGKTQNSFKISSIIIIILTLLITAASIPFFRYIHPVIPLVYIIAVGTIVEILSYQFSKKSLIVVSTLLILFFGVGQTLGVFLLDSRFEADTHNIGKPPVYAELAYKLRDNTNKNDIVLTNLDTWGTWYGERKTVWFPLEPKQIIDPVTGKIPFDVIYLTSYLIDDQNYYMGADWRKIFNNPNDTKKWVCDGCQEIAKEFKLKEVYKILASEDYERQDATAILLVKNNY